MVTIILTVVLAVLGYSLLVLLAVAVLCRSHVRELWKSWRHRGEESDVPEGDGPDYYALDVPPRLRESRQILRAALPSPPVTELVDDYYGTGVIQTRRDVRDALDAVLEDPAETNRRLREIRDNNSDLSELPRQLEDLYVIEVDS